MFCIPPSAGGNKTVFLRRIRNGAVKLVTFSIYLIGNLGGEMINMRKFKTLITRQVCIDCN